MNLEGIRPTCTRSPISGTRALMVSGWNAKEAVDGETLEGGRVYIAPGDFHMVLEAKGTAKVLRLNKNPPENFCRPSVEIPCCGPSPLFMDGGFWCAF